MLPESYFSPSLTIGAVERPLCHGTVGPKEVLTISYNGTDLSLKVSENASSTDLRITINIAKGSSVRWSNSDLILKVNSSMQIEAKLDYFRQLNYVNGEFKNEKYPLGNLMKYLQKPYSTKTTYLAVVNFDITEVSEFEIEGLSFAVSGEQHSIGPISFIKRRGVFMYPLNC